MLKLEIINFKMEKPQNKENTMSRNLDAWQLFYDNMEPDYTEGPYEPKYKFRTDHEALYSLIEHLYEGSYTLNKTAIHDAFVHLCPDLLGEFKVDDLCICHEKNSQEIAESYHKKFNEHNQFLLKHLEMLKVQVYSKCEFDSVAFDSAITNLCWAVGSPVEYGRSLNIKRKA